METKKIEYTVTVSEEDVLSGAFLDKIAQALAKEVWNTRYGQPSPLNSLMDNAVREATDAISDRIIKEHAQAIMKLIDVTAIANMSAIQASKRIVS